MKFADVYKTIAGSSYQALFKEKGSKFFGYAYPVHTESEVNSILLKIKKLHPDARHWCYAWRLGVEKVQYRVNDDGEPNNAAGQPIYGQILSYGVTNVLIVVVRYFGGVKLGVGGLMKAYKTAAQQSLQNATIVEEYLEESIYLEFDYQNMSKVMRLVKQRKLGIVERDLRERCKFELRVKKSACHAMKNDLQKYAFLKVF